MNQSFQILQKQKQIFTQKQLHSLNILSMDTVELEGFLQGEYLENPLLDNLSSGAFVSKKESTNEIYEWSQNLDYSQNLQEYLKSQLNVKKDSTLINALKEYLIECIDETGYFTMPKEEVANKFNIDIEIIEKSLEELKELEPIGVFSSNLEECLLKQVEVHGFKDKYISEIIQNHLEDVSKGNIAQISRSLNLKTSEVRKYILLIESLKPRPVVGFSSDLTNYIVPDIILKKEVDWEIILNDNWIEDYQISDYYLKIMDKTEDVELKEYFNEKLKRLHFIMQNIQQRRTTILRIVNVILEIQKDFFEEKGNLKPMTMGDIAEIIGMNTSTVSRAVKGKYIQYPKETILLKNLFSQKVSTSTVEQDTSSSEVKEFIKVTIENENKAKPLSDQVLVDMLEEKSIYLSRRVVAKYRSELGIKSSFNRKI